MNNEWIVGIVTGIVSSAILFMGSLIARKFIFPQISGLLQRVPNISGAWEYYDTDTDESMPVGHVEIEQWGTRVRATFTRTKGHSGRPMNRIFKASGTFQSAQLVMTFEEVKGAGFILGTFVLNLSSSLKKLSGKATFLHHDEGKVISNDIFIKKLAEI